MTQMAKFEASIDRPKAKSVSASGASPHDAQTRGFAPGPRWGLCPPIDHSYRLALPRSSWGRARPYIPG